MVTWNVVVGRDCHSRVHSRIHESGDVTDVKSVVTLKFADRQQLDVRIQQLAFLTRENSVGGRALSNKNNK